jgi:ParB-like nuclease domain
MNTAIATPETVANNQEDLALRFFPYHAAFESEKLAQLVESMKANGWVGAPLVYFDDQLMTGSHRYRAAELAGLETIPCVKYSDVFCVDAADVDNVVRNHDDWVVELTALALGSDPKVAEYLGMDAH